ncbi:MAG: hypothetical protein SFU98_02380 [Leptospiraceae bacterium]|nr:hypothetical protein [Leptospiraceae bacterium]
MSDELNRKISRKLFFWFSGIMLSVPIFSFFIKFLTDGLNQLPAILRAGFVSPILLLLSFLYFSFQTRKLTEAIELAVKKQHKKNDPRLNIINSFPRRIAFLICLVNLFTASIIEIINFSLGLVFSWQQGLFFWISDLAIALISGSSFIMKQKKKYIQ